MNNKELCERYPFLIIRNRWTGKIPKDYNYEYTELDAMPNGWRKAFGERMCEEIRDALIKEDCLDQYRITQIKEKYGTLRWYDFGAPQTVYDIISKYEYISEFVCELCGSLNAKCFDYGWSYTMCEECAREKYKIDHDEWLELTADINPIQDNIEYTCYTNKEKYTKSIPVADTWCAIMEDAQKLN